MNMDLDKKSLSEVYTVLSMLETDNFNKVPKDLIKAIKNNMDRNYKPSWDNLRNGNMLIETDKILATIYANYLSSTEEKIIINRLINLGCKKQ